VIGDKHLIKATGKIQLVTNALRTSYNETMSSVGYLTQGSTFLGRS